MGPHRDLSRHMNQFEMCRHRFKILPRFCAFNLDFKKRVVVATCVSFFWADGREFLVCGVVRGSDVVGHEDGVCDEMAEADDVSDFDALVFGGGERLAGEDLPVVVCVVVGVSSNLLALGGDTAILIPKRIAVRMAVKIDLGLLVTHGNRIIVIDRHRLKRHNIVAQRLLELRRHEIVSGSGPREDREMNLEPEKIKEEGNDDETNGSGSKVLSEFHEGEGALATVDVHQVPQVN